MNSYEKWKDEYGLEYVRRYSADGLSDGEMAEAMGLKYSVFKRWKKKHPEICEAQRLGRAGADYAVVEALYKKATGYTVSLNKTVKLKRSDFDPETGKKIRDYEELAVAVDQSHVPADIRAGLFWLKSRQPENWSDRADTSASVGGAVDIPDADRIDTYEGDD